MVRRRFSKPPMVGSKSRVSGKAVPGQLPTQVQLFKNTYVFERRMLQRFREGNHSADYKPSATLDGKSHWDTPEEKKNIISVWESTHKKISQANNLTDPCKYVRIIFYILRGSSVAIPTVGQLASPKMLELVAEFLQDRRLEIRQMFVSESQRAQASIRVNNKGAGYPIGLSVYYAIVDSRLGLSPLFRYCLAVETARQLESRGVETENCERLKTLAKQFKLYAAMDYTMFPDHYDEVWGSVIPSDFRLAACSVLETALEQ